MARRPSPPTQPERHLSEAARRILYDRPFNPLIGHSNKLNDSGRLFLELTQEVTVVDRVGLASRERKLTRKQWIAEWLNGAEWVDPWLAQMRRKCGVRT